MCRGSFDVKVLDFCEGSCAGKRPSLARCVPSAPSGRLVGVGSAQRAVRLLCGMFRPSCEPICHVMGSVLERRRKVPQNKPLSFFFDACYDRGSSFRLKSFLNDGAP